MLRRSLEVEIPAQRAVSTRALLKGLTPVLDGVALAVAVVIAGAQPVAICWGLLTMALLHADDSRAHRLDRRVGRELGWLLGRFSVPTFALVAAVSLRGRPWLGPWPDPGHVLVAGATGAFLVVAGRAVASATVRAARARRHASERTIILGSGRLAVELADELGRRPELGLHPVGFLDGSTGRDLPLPVLGEPTDLGRVVHEFEVSRVLVAFGRAGDRELVAVLRGLDGLPVEVYLVPRLYELGSVPPAAVDHVGGIPLVHLARCADRPLGRLAKRALDVAVAGCMLLAAAPILLAAAVGVRLSSPGPVLFRQTRVGPGGRPFEILKFRTMVVNDDCDTAWSAAEDQVTRVGRVLRRTSVDELPQLVNVLRGEMSLVGPRPERPFFVEGFSASLPRYADRLRAKGGITGLAQVEGRHRSMDALPERVRLDNAYIENWSWWGDVLILFRTLGLVFRGDRD